MQQFDPLVISKKHENLKCYHCGDNCSTEDIRSTDKFFCCNGCKLVYELLEANDLCTYYDLENNPGNTLAEAGYKTKFKYLEDESIRRKLNNFSDGKTASLTFFIPSMHCSSCVWLLETLHKLSPLVISSKVDFIKKELALHYQDKPTALRELVELLASIGYEPQINLETLEKKESAGVNRDLYLKIGVAGFCFANIMLFSFPEYLAAGDIIEGQYKTFFNYLSVLLALPVFFYSSSDYFSSALNSWKQRRINMDVPISLGIITLLGRSVFEIFWGTGTGYLDSFAGLVLFLLVGKLFEKKTYETLSFERDYKSYFPVAVTRKTESGEETVALEKLNIRDRMIIRNQELVPADAVLIRGEAYIDYSFVTGESNPQRKESGELVYAGGKQVGGALELDVVKAVNQSYLTSLWNEEVFKKSHASRITTLANTVSRYFTISVITIALGAAVYWAPTDWGLALNALTAVLIIACPCALALSTPFTLGNMLRIFGRNGFYLKNISVLEGLAKISMVVFDKTGTITRTSGATVRFEADQSAAENLSEQEKEAVYALARESGHPLSQQIAVALPRDHKKTVTNFRELAGQGITGTIGGRLYKLGSARFLGLDKNGDPSESASTVYLLIDEKLRGRFIVPNQYRVGLKKTIEGLKRQFKIQLLTGDNDREKQNLLRFFEKENDLHFRQMPSDKLEFVKSRQTSGDMVLMIGDGLNDAGALKQSDVGISISEDVNTFTPASDAIMDAAKFENLADFIKLSQQSLRVIVISFGISFLYNLVGLAFAVSGTLSPLIAAILMPISSITVVVFSTGATTLLARQSNLITYRDGK